MFHCKILAFVWGVFCSVFIEDFMFWSYICRWCIRVYCTSVYFWQKQHSYADWSWVVTICLNAWTEIEFTPKSAKSQGNLKKIEIKTHKQFHAGTSFFPLHQIFAAELLKSLLFVHTEGHSSILFKRRQILQQMSLKLHGPLNVRQKLSFLVNCPFKTRQQACHWVYHKTLPSWGKYSSANSDQLKVIRL